MLTKRILNCERSSRVDLSAKGGKMGMGWRRARRALACVRIPLDRDDDSPNNDSNAITDKEREPANISDRNQSAVSTPPRSPFRFHLIRNSIRFSRSACAICLEAIKPGQGHALFTAECSHIFHFSCIASNVQYGNLICPVCRAHWKEVPWQAPTANLKAENESRSPQTTAASGNETILQQTVRIPQEDERRLDPVLRILDESIANHRDARQSFLREPSIFDDDEPLDGALGTAKSRSLEGNVELLSGRSAEEEVCSFSFTPGAPEGSNDSDGGEECHVAASTRLQVTSYGEVKAVEYREERESFTILIHITAPTATNHPNNAHVREQQENKLDQENVIGSMQQIPSFTTVNRTVNSAILSDPSCRAPVDLVTVLDVSGSMSGTKFALLKRAMKFVVGSLSPSDRLSVITFSSSATRVMPLRRMAEEGRQAALQALNSLVCTGGTNIIGGLRKGEKVLQDRRQRNPVASIMLLSDGQDTSTMNRRAGHIFPPRHRTTINYRGSTNSGSVRNRTRYGHVQIPVHAFGFGIDHDATTMHGISEESGGTFSFIQAEGLLQDAFAQCIGGLLSVVVQDVQLHVSAGSNEGVRLKSIDAGSYENTILDSGRRAIVKLGDMYAEEDRDVLFELRLPSLQCASLSMDAVGLQCTYRDPVSQQIVETPHRSLSIARPEHVERDTAPSTSAEVERQRNRLRTARTIAEAREVADRGDILGAQKALQAARLQLQDSAALQRGDPLSAALEAELTEIQLRMASRHMYETCGRAYLLSAQSSHFRQRATTRGADGCGSSSRYGGADYQTSAMAGMVLRSQKSTARCSTTSPARARGEPPSPSPSPRSSSSPRRASSHAGEGSLCQQ